MKLLEFQCGTPLEKFEFSRAAAMTDRSGWAPGFSGKIGRVGVARGDRERQLAQASS